MKKKNILEREDKMVLGAFNAEFEIETVRGHSYILKPLSVGKLGLLNRIMKRLNDLGELESFMVMFWVSIEDTNRLLKILKDESVEESFYTFLDNFLAQDIETIVDITKKMSEIVNSGIVEVESDEKK